MCDSSHLVVNEEHFLFKKSFGRPVAGSPVAETNSYGIIQARNSVSMDDIASLNSDIR